LFGSKFPITTPVVGAYFFYNNRAFDGRNPAANAADDNAVAPDKYPSFAPVKPAAERVPANYTTYDKGINGIMLDVAGAAAGAPLTAADFKFEVEEGVRPTGRPVTRPAPAPSAITVRPGAGVNGSDRVTLTWPDGAIRNAWLLVTYLRAGPADRSMGFGNLAGNTVRLAYSGLSGAPRYVRVDALDLAAMRSRLNGATADLTNRYDHNRDGRVDVLDLAVIRFNLGAVLTMLADSGK
jgi:hypothetical protein